MFTYLGLPPLPKLIEKMVDGRRFYVTEDGVTLPSVTTILSHQPKPQLEAWKKKVGVEKSEQIRDQSATRGHNLHTTIEQYLKNQPIKETEMFCDLKPYLNKIYAIHYLEAQLFSKEIGLAGRVDCIGSYDGILSVIDFKNARKRRTQEMIHTYFIQVCAYSGLYEAMTGLKINQGVILMAVESQEPQIFVFDTRKYVPDLIEAIKIYKKAVDIVS